MASRRVIAMVTGVPGSGKSTLAGLLSGRLGLPVLAKDTVKEALFDTLTTTDRAAISRAAAEVIWRLLPSFRAGAVIDMWLDPVRDVGVGIEGLLRSGGLDDTVEILCSCPGDVAAARYEQRVRSGAHLSPDDDTLDRIRRSAALMTPLGAGPVLYVDATKPFDTDGIVKWIVDSVA